MYFVIPSYLVNWKINYLNVITTNILLIIFLYIYINIIITLLIFDDYDIVCYDLLYNEFIML